jgi:hypothetical protein
MRLAVHSSKLIKSKKSIIMKNPFFSTLLSVPHFSLPDPDSRLRLHHPFPYPEDGPGSSPGNHY